jgi:hypothetical protein
MDRLIKCVRFQSKRITRFTVVFTLIYVAFYIVIIATTAIGRAQLPKDGTINANFGYIAIILAFIGISTSYKGFYNNLMIFGNTRPVILTSFLAFSAVLSAVLAVLAEISELINGCVGRFLPFVRMTGLADLYPSLNPAQELLWFFTFILVFVLVGYLYGALTYKFGKIFVVGFWCGIGILFTFSSLFMNENFLPVFQKGAESFFGYGAKGGVYLCSLHFFIVSLVLGIMLWLIAIRQPQNA